MAYIQGELIVNNDDILLPRTVTEQVAVTANQNLKEKLNEMEANIESVTNEVKDARTNGNTNITYNNLKARLDDEHKKLNNEIEKTNTQLSQIEKQSLPRKFKPIFSTCVWTSNEADGSSIGRDFLDACISSYIDCGFESMTLFNHFRYNEVANDLYFGSNIDTIEYVIDQLKQKNISIPFMKIHDVIGLQNIRNMGVDTFKRRYKEMLEVIFKICVDNGIEYIGLFNENSHMWKKDILAGDGVLPNDFIDFVIECIELAKTYNLKPTVSVAGFGVNGWGTWESVDKRIKEKCEVFMINFYPSVGVSNERTTKEECLYAWENCYSLKHMLSYIKSTYGKKVIISETGLNDSWYSYINPGDYTIVDENPSNGENVPPYLYGLFESLRDRDDIICVNWWYTSTFYRYGKPSIPIIKEYTKVGVK